MNCIWTRLILPAAILAAATTFATTSENKVIRVSASAQASPLKITLSWPATSGTRSFVLFRKSKEITDWGLPLAILPANATSYTDAALSAGTTYEYSLYQEVPGDAFPHGRFGYVYSGIEVPMVESRGKIILLVDSTQAGGLVSQLARLQEDLTGDGWTVLRHDISPTASVPSVKNIILSDYNAAPTSVKAVYLLGHIPVPYAGNIYWDGHPDHKGAWPADIFYGDMNGVWTDTTVNNTTAKRTQNHNVPGDGKYDNSIVPSRVELMVGRVDFHDMPAFSLSETQLLARYLDKSHNFRHAITTVKKRALVDDNFTTLSEGPAASGWHYSSLVGAPNVTAGDWSTLTTSDYLLGYGCGGSGYTGVGGVVSTSECAANTYRVIFQLFFGSYFGDWDNRNNVLRAAIAGPTYGLTSAWGSRPNWFLHHMGMGEPVGTGYLASTEIAPYITSFGGGSVHVALMGDPTLRLAYTPPASNLSTTTSDTATTLAWTASPDNAVQGYNVYRASSSSGPYTRLNGSLVTGTSYADGKPLAGTSTYMVRAVRLETSSSGTYYNGSQGIFKSHSRTTATPPPAPVITTNGGNGPGANFTTNSTALVLTGTCSTSLTSIKVNNSLTGVSYVPGSANWSYTRNLAQGANVLSVTGVNTQSLTSAADTITITLDSIAPATPVITTNGGKGVGLSFATDNPALVLTGTTTSDTSAILMNGSRTGVTYVPGARNWIYANTLVKGLNTFSVKALDAAGNSSSPRSISVTLSTVTPLSDTDSDGIPDVTEAGAATNPLDPQSFDPVVYVDGKSGDDVTGLGTRAHPWATPAHAITAIQGSAARILTIRVAQGTYAKLNKDGGPLRLESYESLLGGYEAAGWTRDTRAFESVLDASTAVNGGPAGNVVVLDGVVGAVLDGFTVTGADSSSSANPGGAGILCMDLDSSSTIANCRITYNFSNANGSGGILLIDASPSILQCTVAGNATAGAGGGIGITGNSAPDISKSTISGNDATSGAGIYAGDTADLALVNCVLSGNNSTLDGGGLYLDGASAVVANCTVAHNAAAAQGGGGVRVLSGANLLVNCILAGNAHLAVSTLSDATAPRLEHCLFNANGEGIYYSFNTGSPVTLTEAAAVNGQVPGAKSNAQGNTDFNMMPTGTWTATPVYNATTRRTKLTDATAAFAPGALRGSFVALSQDSILQALVLDNTATTLEVLEDYSAIVRSGSTYRIVSYHLGTRSAAVDRGRDTSGPADGAVVLDFDGFSRGADGDGNGAATSDGSDYDIGAFERGMAAPAGRITVLAPNGGETLVSGESWTLRWAFTGTAGDTVNIVAWKGSTSRVIAIGTRNDGSFIWPVPLNYLPGPDYRIEISSVSVPAIRDTSDSTFAIATP